MEKTDFILRHPASADVPALKALWKTVFGDSDALIDAFFGTLYSPGGCMLAERGGAAVSAGYCVPGAAAGGLKCSYIYAMATLPEFRGRGAAGGVAMALCKNAFDGGADIVATLPASDGLSDWYCRILGMAPAFAKGGGGVSFAPAWHSFAAVCGGHSDGTPSRLVACRRDGGDVSALASLGWELTFD